MKAPGRFRAVKYKGHLAIEFFDGNWSPKMAGLDRTFVQKQFERLAARGAIIESTADFEWEDRKVCS